MCTDLEAARTLVYNAARLKEADQDYVKQAAMCKLYASNVNETLTFLSLERDFSCSSGGHVGDEQVRRAPGWRWFHARLPRGKVLSRLQDRYELDLESERTAITTCRHHL